MKLIKRYDEVLHVRVGGSATLLCDGRTDKVRVTSTVIGYDEVTGCIETLNSTYMPVDKVPAVGNLSEEAA